MWENAIAILKQYRKYEQLNSWLPGQLFILSLLGQGWSTPSREEINSDPGCGYMFTLKPS